DTDIIDKLNAKLFYKRILYKLKDLEYNADFDEKSIKVLGQRYNFIKQRLEFSLSTESEALSDDIEIFKISLFDKKIPTQLISFRTYREPIFNLQNKYNNIYSVRVTILESLFNQKFYIVDYRRNISFNLS